MVPGRLMRLFHGTIEALATRARNVASLAAPDQADGVRSLIARPISKTTLWFGSDRSAISAFAVPTHSRTDLSIGRPEVSLRSQGAKS